eukprot:scaffold40102_cov54-Phaeocystis_antarctica.AAC.7
MARATARVRARARRGPIRGVLGANGYFYSLEFLVQVRQELKAEKNSMALSFVTIHPSLNMTTRLVGPRPQPTTRTPWPLRPDLSSQRWRPHARPVLPLFRL